MEYDPGTKATTVLLHGLQFANGVALPNSEEYLLFCESTLARVSKLYLRGPKKGRTEIFIDNLPGYPDNIHKNAAGDRFFVAVLGNRNALTDFVFKTPVLKHLLAWDTKLWDLYNNMEKIARFVEVDAKGKPVKLYEDSTGSVMGYVTTAVPAHDGHLYVGSLRDNFVGRLKM